MQRPSLGSRTRLEAVTVLVTKPKKRGTFKMLQKLTVILLIVSSLSVISVVMSPTLPVIDGLPSEACAAGFGCCPMLWVCSDYCYNDPSIDWGPICENQWGNADVCGLTRCLDSCRESWGDCCTDF